MVVGTKMTQLKVGHKGKHTKKYHQVEHPIGYNIALHHRPQPPETEFIIYRIHCFILY
jgi:hypothetical protein